MKSKQLLFLIFLLTLIASFSFLPVHAETLSVTATVPPRPADFQFLFTIPTNPATIAPNDVLPFEITYGVKPAAGINTTTTLTADWNGIVASDGTRMAEYVPGSATTAYGNASPVVDLINRTLTWNIPSLPPGSLDNQVNFNLKINSNYLQSDTIAWNVGAKMSNQYVTLPEKLISNTSSYIAPPSTNTQSTTSTANNTSITSSHQTTSQKPSTSVKSTTQPHLATQNTPTTANQAPQVSFNAISDSGVSITTDGRRIKTLTIRYGKSPTTLFQTLTIKVDADQEQVKLDKLLPATSYFFQITATDLNDQVSKSDILTFKTAQTSTTPKLEENVSVITSNGSVLLSDVKDKSGNKTPLALVQINTPYEITYTVKNKLALKSIEAVVRNKVLGTNTFSQVLGTQEIVVPMIEKEPNIYVANLEAFQPGTYEIFVRIIDTLGNLKEEKIAEAKIMPHFSVYDQETDEPLSDARVYFYFYNEATKKYEPVPRNVSKNIRNPAYTDSKGEIDILLPKGTYRADVSSFGHEEKTVNFTLGPKSGEEFPRVYLKKDPFTFGYILRYLKYNTIDLLTQSNRYFQSLSLSIRFFNLIALATLITFVIICFLFFIFRTHLHPLHLIAFFMHHTQTLLRSSNPTYTPVLVVNDRQEPITQAKVACIDEKTGKVDKQYTTNKTGTCYLPTKDKHLNLLVTKEGFLPTEALWHVDDNTQKPIILCVASKPVRSIIAACGELIARIGGMLFECALVFSLIAEIFFFSVFGFGITLPFFIISLLNTLLWLFFLREKRLSFRK